MEHWKPIKDYECLYEVSDLGRVRRVDGIVKSGIKHNPTTKHNGRVLKQSKKRNGYLTVDLSKENKVKTISVHRLVAEAFLDKVYGKEYINHINCNKSDNRAENLEWCTAKENSEHARKNGLYCNPNKKAIRCKQTGMVFVSSYAAAEWINETVFKYSRQTRGLSAKIRSASLGHQKTAYGYTWERV